MDNTIEFILMLIGAATFWFVMWKLATFVCDLIEHAVKSRNQKEKQ